MSSPEAFLTSLFQCQSISWFPSNHNLKTSHVHQPHPPPQISSFKALSVHLSLTSAQVHSATSNNDNQSSFPEIHLSVLGKNIENSKFSEDSCTFLVVKLPTHMIQIQGVSGFLCALEVTGSSELVSCWWDPVRQHCAQIFRRSQMSLSPSTCSSTIPPTDTFLHLTMFYTTVPWKPHRWVMKPAPSLGKKQD